MSLLNEMLKDLDRRKMHQPVNLLIPPLNRHWINILPSMLCGLLVLIALSFLVYMVSTKRYESRPLKRVVIEEPHMAVDSAPLISQAVPEPVFDSQVVLDEASSTIFPEPNTLEPVVNKQPSRQTPEEWHDEHFNHALEAIERGDDSRAVELLELILTRFPASIEARESLGAIYLSLDDLPKAYEVIETGIKYEPHNLRLTSMMARLLVAQGQHKEALALLKQFHPSMNSAPDYYGLLAAIFEGLGRTTEAGSLYQSLVKIEPSNGRYWLGFAIALENKKANQQAIDAYIRASQSETSQPDIRSYAEGRLKILQG